MNYGDKPLTIPPEEGGTPETARSIRAITEVGLPLLRGSEADIAAATEIRMDKLIAADDVLTQLRADEKETEQGDRAAMPPEIPVSDGDLKAAQRALNALRHQDDAAWWVAHRDRTAQELITMFADRHPLPLSGHPE